MNFSTQRSGSPFEITEDHVLSILCVRRAREATIGRDLFSDPAWDILLELYAGCLGERQITTRDLARAINIPASTTTRWIKILRDRGFVTATEAGDPVGLSIELSTSGVAVMKHLVGYWGSAFQSI